MSEPRLHCALARETLRLGRPPTALNQFSTAADPRVDQALGAFRQDRSGGASTESLEEEEVEAVGNEASFSFTITVKKGR